MQELKSRIEHIWENRDILHNEESKTAIREVIEHIDKGRLRTAEPTNEGWQVNEWVKKLSFCIFLFRKWRLLRLVHLNFMIK